MPLLAGCSWLRSWDARQQPAACAGAREHCMRCLRRPTLASAAAAMRPSQTPVMRTQTISGCFWLPAWCVVRGGSFLFSETGFPESGEVFETCLWGSGGGGLLTY